MKTKICNCCNLEFPKTKDYFFTKIIKQQNKSGMATYNSLRSICKNCSNKKTQENRIKKRCKEMNCDVLDYRENWKKQYSETRILFKEINDAPMINKTTIHNKIRNGYIYTTYEQYRIDCRKNLSQVRRKYNYGDIDFVPKGTQTGIKHLTDGYVALTIRLKVKEVPKEMIELKRLIIQIKREIKNN